MNSAARQSTGPPGPDVSAAPKLLGVTGALYLIVLLFYGARMYTRLRPVPHLGWDDYTITAGLVLALLEWLLLLVACQYGVARHNYYVPVAEQPKAQHILYASEVPWSSSMMFIKISIACMLLRIKRSRPWMAFIWGMIAVQIASCIASTVFQLVQCIPLAAVWDPTAHPAASCAKQSSAFISIYVNSSIAIATDLIFACLPLTFIRKMQRPMREKIILSLLMGLGIFAAGASIVKTTLIKKYGLTGDTLWDAVDLSMWSVLEEQTGIVAACIPCLKSPFERILGRFGLISSKGRTAYGLGTRYDKKGNVQLSSLRSRNGGLGSKAADAQSEESILPPGEDSLFAQAANGQIVKTVEMRFEEEEIVSPKGGVSVSEEEDSWKVVGAKDAVGGKGSRKWDAV